MELAAYFDRIGYSGPRDSDLTTLEALMRAHIGSVPFENLDVLLERRTSTALPASYDKIVGERRGGWCYEQNGLFGWALEELGFDVRRISCGVMRAIHGDASLGSHLGLIVTLDRPWLVDVGFGGSHAMPLPLAETSHEHAPYGMALSRLDDGYWQFNEWVEPGNNFGYDFTEQPADEALLAQVCVRLQTSPDSVFVQNLVVQQRQGASHRSLRGRVLSSRDARGETRKLLSDADELVEALDRVFGLDLPQAAGLWDRVAARHVELFADDAAALSA